MMERAQLDISDPYKVYRLVPLSEQGKSSGAQLGPPAGYTGHSRFSLY